MNSKEQLLPSTYSNRPAPRQSCEKEWDEIWSNHIDQPKSVVKFTLTEKRAHANEEVGPYEVMVISQTM